MTKKDTKYFEKIKPIKNRKWKFDKPIYKK